MDSPPSAGDHPAQRWITATFGNVDPFALMEQARAGRGWAPKTGRDGRSVTEEKVFIILGLALERHDLAAEVVDHLARDVVRAAGSSPADESTAALEILLNPWGLPQHVLAHLVRVISRVVRGG